MTFKRGDLVYVQANTAIWANMEAGYQRIPNTSVAIFIGPIPNQSPYNAYGAGGRPFYIDRDLYSLILTPRDGTVVVRNCDVFLVR
jgi:hypothetical protein